MSRDKSICVFVYSSDQESVVEIFDGDTQKLGSAAGMLIMMAYLLWHLLRKK